ncbi:dehydrin protein [Tripterygium wilfordii]|uniref:Dehydrin protein n=1 Tax=Tripterygium wilfordii TaxID=458696 RepID=A0A7J7D3M4_TRIWF|nr:dehydrin ERD14-like [Tripterygium wilfordii]KAF5740923.1 dehydrin protein [Tripterygium wilfordii]
MAEENQQKIETTSPVVGDEGVEAKDRGLFGFGGKKEEEAVASEFGEKVKVSETEHKPEEEEKEKKHGSLLEKLHRTSSSSSSSSDEEEGEGEEKKKKKKEKKKKPDEGDFTVPVEKIEEPAASEEKKGFLEKIKEKLPGQHKKTEEVPPSPPPPPATESAATTEAAHEGEAKEKKGFLDKIKGKLPGYHAKTEEEKQKEKESASH